MYSCNCADALIRTTICKHIHLVIRSSNSVSTEPFQREETYIDSHNPMLLTSLQQECNLSDIDTYREGVRKQILELSGQIQLAKDIDTLKQCKTFIQSAINLIKAKQSSSITFPANSNEPTNKIIQKQRSFFSTKRKRKTAIRIAKPTLCEKQDIYTALDTNTISMYGEGNKGSSAISISRPTISMS